jgi:hypothetical protein
MTAAVCKHEFRRRGQESQLTQGTCRDFDRFRPIFAIGIAMIAAMAVQRAFLGSRSTTVASTPILVRPLQPFIL